jgi:drug/metabolite transporter (DMT)-like permease
LPERSAHLAGIGLMLLAMLLFSMNDALGKWLVASYTVAQILFIRSIGGLTMLSPFVARTGAKPFREAPRPLLQVLRVALATGETALFYVAVSYMPLADAMTFYLAGPIYVTALSAPLLREHVGVYRWSAVLVGFAGVVIALDPTGEFVGKGAAIALVGSVGYALLMVVTRKLRDTNSIVMASTQMMSSLLFGGVGIAFGWSPVTLPDLVLLLLLGVVAVGALMCVNQSLRLAPASVVVPYQYSLIVWAVIFGYFVFGDVPKLHTLVGAAIIVASGLFIFLREQRLKVPSAEEPALAER